MVRLLLGAVCLCASAVPARAQFGDRFLWTQIRHGGDWDPHKGAYQEVLEFMDRTTSIRPLPERRVADLLDDRLFSSPFAFLAGRGETPDLSEEAVRRLRSYLTSGGFLWIDDASGSRSSSFDRWVRRMLKAALPEAPLEPISSKHALYRSFYLLSSAVGRTAIAPSFEGVRRGRRTVVVYSRNDILGAWAKDALGKPLLPCVPGGEPQRLNAKLETGNIILYALTGSYKLDAVHQPFILRKLRGGQP